MHGYILVSKSEVLGLKWMGYGGALPFSLFPCSVPSVTVLTLCPKSLGSRLEVCLVNATHPLRSAGSLAKEKPAERFSPRRGSWRGGCMFTWTSFVSAHGKALRRWCPAIGCSAPCSRVLWLSKRFLDPVCCVGNDSAHLHSLRMP